MKTTSFILSMCLGLVCLQLAAQTLPYSTGFDNTQQQQGWQLYQIGDIGSSAWNMSGGGFSMSNALSHDYNVGADPSEIVDDWMVSPPLAMTAPSIISLMARESGFSTPTMDNCEVYVSAGSADPSDGQYVLIGNLSFIGPQFTWIDTTFYCAITGPACHLAFRYKTIGAAWCTYAIDDVNVILDPASYVYDPLSASQQWRIYPNPVSEELCITFSETLSAGELRITNSAGKLMATYNVNDLPLLKVDLQDYSPGVYFAQWHAHGIVSTAERFVVN